MSEPLRRSRPLRIMWHSTMTRNERVAKAQRELERFWAAEQARIDTLGLGNPNQEAEAYIPNDSGEVDDDGKVVG